MAYRHRILGCKLHGSPSSWAKEYKERFRGLGHYPVGGNLQIVREFDIGSCVAMMAMCHLGYKIPVAAEEFLNRGFDVVVDYFCGDWWKADPDAIKNLDKTRKRQRWGDLRWFGAFSDGILLGLWSARWQELAKVCSWVEADLKYEYLGDEVEEELVRCYCSIAAGLRPEPMPGLEKQEAKIRKCRLLRPRLLFQAWEAARKGDQAAFDAAFVKSLEHFAANYGSGRVAIDWVAPHQSVLALAARRLGLQLPSLPPKLEAVVITRESLGLAPSPG